MNPGFESLRVMLVDDNQHMRAIVATMLLGFGIRHIRECRDGRHAFEQLADFAPDLALVDFQMSGVDGVGFTRLVRADPGSPAPFLPIIMMTGHSERPRVLEARDAGVTEFVVKPLTARALLDRIEAVIYRPRAFIRTPDFFGPDRRRRQDPEHLGPWRREGDDALRPGPGRRRGEFAARLDGTSPPT